MASFDENGKYIKTNWKAGDKITATKLNKIEESIEAVNDNDISRHVEADARLDALEAKDVAHDKEFTNIKNTIADNKAAAELGDYEINSRMQFLEEELNEGIEEVHNVASTMDGKIAQAEADMAAMVAEVESEMNEIQNDMTNAQTQTFTVTDAYKFAVDHDGMMPSLVALDNIEGLSSIETNSKGNKEIVSRAVNHICTIDKSKNYFDDAVVGTIHGDTTTNTRENNDITVTSNAQGGAVAYSVTNLEEGKKYCMLCDDIIITQGDAHFQAATPVEYKPLRSTIDLQSSHYNAVFIGNELCTVTFHCSRSSNSGNVTYKNVQIYEVKEMIVPDIQLNSLPNGVKDEIKDGMLIKRTNRINLAELTWVPSSTNDQFPESEFIVYYTLSIQDLIAEPPTSENEPGYILCNNIPSVLNIVTASADPSNTTYNRVGISGHRDRSEIRIKLYRSDAPDLASLNTWLTNNNVYAVYELATPEYIPVNLTIKADKGDTVVINTTKTMDLTYDIQLNTRAQIDALQEISQQMLLCKADINTSINTGITPNLDKQYYILPGGIIMQWGVVLIAANSLTNTYRDIIIDFMIPFTEGATMFQCSLSGGDDGWDGICSGHPISLHHARVVARNINPTIDNRIYWFAIGY